MRDQGLIFVLLSVIPFADALGNMSNNTYNHAASFCLAFGFLIAGLLLIAITTKKGNKK